MQVDEKRMILEARLLISMNLTNQKKLPALLKLEIIVPHLALAPRQSITTPFK